MKRYAVYILKCSDDKYYTGITNDIDRRLSEYKEGENKDAYTYKRRPIKLLFYQEIDDPNNAIDAEKQIKKWSIAKKRPLLMVTFIYLKH